jgi:hypothetical protein
MHIKNRNKLKWTQNSISVCSLRKILLVCAFYKTRVPLCIGVMLPKLCKSWFVMFLHHVLGVTKIGVLNKSFSPSNLVFARKNSWS